jgi:rhamnulokinase
MGSYIAIDLGAESGRVILGRFNQDRLALEEIHRFPNTPIHDSNMLSWNWPELWSNIKKGVGLAIQEAATIDAIGVDTWGVDFGLLDSSGNLVESPRHYRDRRTEGIVEKAESVLSAASLYQHTGIQIMPFNSVYQLWALSQSKPELVGRPGQLLFMPDLIAHALTGQTSCEYTIASTSGMMDMRSGDWSRPVLDALHLPGHLLGDCIQPGTQIGTILPELQEAWQCGPIPVIATTSHDTAAAVAGVPADPSEPWAYLSSGTWSLLGVESPMPIINEKTAEHQLTNEGGVQGTIRILKNIMGLWILQSCRRAWQASGEEIDYTSLTLMAQSADAFAGYINPESAEFFTGEDMPEKIRAYLKRTGQAEVTDIAQTARLILEALAFRYREVLSWLDDLRGEKAQVLHIVGGGSQNQLLNQMTSDATGRRVLAGPVEATVCGNILMQALAKGDIKSLSQGRQIIRRSFPVELFDPQDTAVWDKELERAKLFWKE